MSQSEIIDGKAIAEKVEQGVALDAKKFFDSAGRLPVLATVLVGDDPASATYVRVKHRACKRVGIESVHREFPASVSQRDLQTTVDELVADDRVDGILVQLPLPDGLEANSIIMSIPPEKDVDGFHPQNLGLLAAGQEGGVVSCTPEGVMRLLDSCGVELEGKRAVVIGRSRIVGLPMALLLLERDATVTVTHNKTRNLGALTREADVLVSAAGVPRLVTADMVKPGAVVVDVGTTRTEDGLRGDVDFAAVREVASLLTPVPGGVGPMTIAMLMESVIKLARARHAMNG